MPYRAPVDDIRFILDHVVGYADLAATERFSEAGPDVADAILVGAGRLAEDVLAPLQRVGDTHPARLENGIVRTPPGFAEGYRAIAEGGWIGICADPEYGGMGLPMTLGVAVMEMIAGACLSLELCPLLSIGQIETLERHAPEDIRALYLPRLVSGEWTGTMNLTEAQAGSDLGALRCRAEPLGDGRFAITGTKVFITWGDHDVAPNVVHLVLARLSDAPAGNRGISLFLVPRNLPDEQGRPGAANGVRVTSLEHKLGVHGSPTALMDYDRATGWMIGAPGRGIAALFTMMNNARLHVGVQAVGVAEAACQQALDWALQRVQGRTPSAAGTSTIAGHADVRRMLAETRAEIFAARALMFDCAMAYDRAAAGAGEGWAARAAILTPVAKAHGSEVGIAAAQAGIQVHGGMGYIEETGAAQYLRDVRVTSIYEGTNGIQALDLVGRKLTADHGAAALALIDEVAALAAQEHDPALVGIAEATGRAAAVLRAATEAMLAASPLDRAAGSMPFLRAFARVMGGGYHLRAARVSAGRAALARVYAGRLLPEVDALVAQARAGAADLYGLADADLAACGA